MRLEHLVEGDIDREHEHDRRGGKAHRDKHLLEVIDILTAYMTLIWTRMHRYAVGPEPLTIQRYLDNIRIVTAACIAYGGYLIDIYT